MGVCFGETHAVHFSVYLGKVFEEIGAVFAMKPFQFGQPGLKAFDFLRVGFNASRIVPKTGGDILNLDTSGLCLIGESFKASVILRGVPESSDRLGENGTDRTVGFVKVFIAPHRGVEKFAGVS